MSYRNQKQKAKLILERGNRLKLNPSCRILSLAKKVLDTGSNRDPGQPGYQELVEALYELPAWAYIFDHIDDSEFRGGCAEMLSLATKDSVLLKDSISNKGRNAQLELLIYATLKEARLSPTRNKTGPDFNCTVLGQTYSVEVKRITSSNPDKIIEGIKTARAQIKNSKKPGAIILDFSASSNPTNEPLKAFLHPTEYRKIVDEYAIDTMERFIKPKQENLLDGSVFNVILRCYHQIPAGKNADEFYPWTVLIRWHTMNTVPEGGRAREISEYFETSLISKLPT